MLIRPRQVRADRLATLGPGWLTEDQAACYIGVPKEILHLMSGHDIAIPDDPVERRWRRLALAAAYCEYRKLSTFTIVKRGRGMISKTFLDDMNRAFAKKKKKKQLFGVSDNLRGQQFAYAIVVLTLPDLDKAKGDEDWFTSMFELLVNDANEANRCVRQLKKLESATLAARQPERSPAARSPARS